MRTLLSTAAILCLGMASAAQAGDRVVVRGGGVPGGANRPAPVKPGGWTRPTPATPGGWNRPAPVRPGGWQHSGPVRPGGWTRPTPGKPGWQHGGVNRPRWGGRIQGRWWAGYRAPGGWNAYRRPVRGWALPTYWSTPNWYINDWSGYGLPQPPVGYNWSRYYDDAVLIDGRGSVYDTIGGVDWDQYDADGVDYSYDEAADGYDGHAYADQAPGAPYAYPPQGYAQRDTGAGGAALGAVVGGAAGAAIAGRGNRLGGALIGGGVGALTGYAIDKAENRGHVPPPPGYGADYPPPPPHGYPPAVATRAAPPPPVIHHGPAPVVTSGPGTTVVTTGAGYGAGGYYANGYYYPGATTTTVTVQTQPVVTTTTTEIWEDEVTYSRPAVKKVWRKKSYAARPRCICK